MVNSSGNKRILIIDRQEFWRNSSAEALNDMGFSVHILEDYNYSHSTNYFSDGPPDLVILGCIKVGKEEREVINRVLADKLHLLVLCATLPWGDLRSVFLAGADDVADKPYDNNRLMNLVEEVLSNINARSSYQMKERDKEREVAQ